MPDGRETIEKKFWQWTSDTYNFGRFTTWAKNFDITPYWNYFIATQLSSAERAVLAGEKPREPGEAQLGKKKYLPGAITDEQWQEWNKYRQAGGHLDLYVWVDAGEPTAEEERAVVGFRDRLNLYLNAQVANGSMSKEHALLTSQDIVDRYLGVGAYKGKPQRLLDFPSTLLTTVRNYIASLSEARQKEIEKAETEAQQQRLDIAHQKMELPLGVGGTQVQQVTAAYQAIRNLNLQLETSPDYLKPVIQGQINQLQDAISRLGEEYATQARIRTQKAEAVPVKEEEGPGTFAQAFAKQYGMTPGAAVQTGVRYMMSPNREEFGNLTKQEQASLAWVGMEAAGMPALPEPPKPFEPPEFENLGETGPPLWRTWFARRYPAIAGEFKERLPEERTGETWSEYLAKERARIRGEFAQQPYYARGERPGEFAPKVKTVVF